MEATVASASVLRAESRNFYVWMAGAFLLIAFGGFTPTYWAKMATGSFWNASTKWGAARSRTSLAAARRPWP